MNRQSKQHPYWIPKNYYEPAMFALKVFSSDNRFNRAVDIAYHFYTADPTADCYISPAKLDRNKLAKHLAKWILNS